MSRTHLGRTATLLVAPSVLALVLTASALTAPAAAKVPPTPDGLPTSLEAMAPYVGPNSCKRLPQPGTAKLGALLVATWPKTSWSGARDCTTAVSEHHDGRAVDWMTNVRTAYGKKRADDLIRWLLKRDGRGHRYANARRLGVMYLIWNNRIWSSYRAGEGWRVYNGCTAKSRRGTAYDTTCHRNHVHLSLSWPGARGYTSYWDKTSAGVNYGPCRPRDLNWAARYTKRRATPCPSYARVTAPAGSSTLHRSLVAYSGLRITSGMRGPAVSAVQKVLKLPVTGVWDARSRATMRTYKGARHMKANAKVGADVWRSLLRTTAPKARTSLR